MPVSPIPRKLYVMHESNLFSASPIFFCLLLAQVLLFITFLDFKRYRSIRIIVKSKINLSKYVDTRFTNHVGSWSDYLGLCREGHEIALYFCAMFLQPYKYTEKLSYERASKWVLQRATMDRYYVRVKSAKMKLENYPCKHGVCCVPLGAGAV